MTPQELNKLLTEANESADKSIQKTKEVIALVEGTDILDGDKITEYFVKKEASRERI